MKSIVVYDGKYTAMVPEEPGERFHALRYGEPWRDLTGDGFVLALCQEISQLQEELAEAKRRQIDLERELDDLETALKYD